MSVAILIGAMVVLALVAWRIGRVLGAWRVERALRRRSVDDNPVPPIVDLWGP